MSAFLCSADHIGQLASLLTHAWPHWSDPILRYDADPEWSYSNGAADSYRYAFRLLWTENAASVAHRYHEPPQPCPDPIPVVRVDPLTLPAGGALRVVKAVHCYAYQACEHPGWETSLAKKLCAELESRAIHSMPAYRSAQWGAPFTADEMAAQPVRVLA